MKKRRPGPDLEIAAKAEETDGGEREGSGVSAPPDELKIAKPRGGYKMTRKRYEITINFNYKNGMTGGCLNTTVNSKSAVQRQIDANRKWLKIKGHTEVSLTIREVI